MGCPAPRNQDIQLKVRGTRSIAGVAIPDPKETHIIRPSNHFTSLHNFGLVASNLEFSFN